MGTNEIGNYENTWHAVFEAIVTEELPQKLFRLRADDGSLLVAGPSPEAKRYGLDIREGQRVMVRRARLDPARGMIFALAPQSERRATRVKQP